MSATTRTRCGRVREARCYWKTPIFGNSFFRFDHERAPERVVHATGFGAHGYFANYEAFRELTMADLTPGLELGTSLGERPVAL